MLLLSFLRTYRPFRQPRDLIAASLLRRSTPSGIDLCRHNHETEHMDVFEFFEHPLEPSQLEEESFHTQQPDAIQQTALLDKIQQISERLFPGPVSFDHTFDPEEPTCEYTVFDVTARGSFSDYRELIFQWHDEVECMVPSGGGDFRLIVHPQQ